MKGVPICCLVSLQELDSSFCCMDKVEHRMLAAVVSAKPTYSVVITQLQNLVILFSVFGCICRYTWHKMKSPADFAALALQNFMSSLHICCQLNGVF